MTAMRVMRLPPVSTVELDNLIRSPFGAGEQRQRHGKVERLGRLEVDDAHTWSAPARADRPGSIIKRVRVGLAANPPAIVRATSQQPPRFDPSCDPSSSCGCFP